MDGKRIDNVTYNQMYDMPACYGSDRRPYLSNDHLLERVPEVIRLARDPRAKLQYFQAMFDFVADDWKGDRP